VKEFPLWLSQIVALWQYANMETSRIGYLRFVANENDAPNRIRELREAKGLNQAQLAELANVTPSALNKLEKGHRGLDLDWMLRLAPLLECSPADLLPDYANPFRLRDHERDVVERMRAASSKELETFDKVADAILPDTKARKEKAA
jgi:transcriptional regulator with XRE-family HTH domain